VKVIATIEGISFGLRDVGVPCLWFSVKFDKASGALIAFTGDEIYDFLKIFNVKDIRKLEGKLCIVEFDGFSVEFIRVLEDN
jgi:hypothetical protein